VIRTFVELARREVNKDVTDEDPSYYTEDMFNREKGVEERERRLGATLAAQGPTMDEWFPRVP
jgi:hypothetical protein